MSKQNIFTALIRSIQTLWVKKPTKQTKYLTATLSFYEVMSTNPPGLHLTEGNGWNDDSIKAWLRNKGFDMSREIKKEECISTCAYIYSQEIIEC